MKKNLFSICILVLMLFCLCACGTHNSNSLKQDVDHAITALKTVFINGDSISYMDLGKGEPLVLVHGSIGDYRVWENQIDTFATKYRVIAYSRRYAWPNAKPLSDTLDYSAGRHAKDLAQLIKTLNLGRAHLVGHSWGGYTVLKTAIDHPELVKSMVLGEPPVQALIAGSKEGDSLIVAFKNNSLKPAAKFFSEQQKDSAVAIFVAGVMGNKDFYGAVPEEVRKRWLMNTTESEGYLITDMWTPVSVDEVKQLKIPTLLVYGEYSPAYLTKITDTLHVLLPNNTLKMLTKASHGLQRQNPKEFNAMVLNFLNKQQ